MSKIDISYAIPTVQGRTVPKNVYFFDPENDSLYTNKNGTWRALYGAIKSSDRQFTLTAAHTCNTPQQLRRFTITLPYLRSMIKAHAALQPAAAETKGWIIGILDSEGSPKPSASKVHATEQAVNAEIERVAKLTPGKTFVKLRVEAYVTVPAPTVNWH